MFPAALSRRQLLLACLATAALVVLVASPGLLGERVGDALEGLEDADARWLWAAAALFVAMHALGGLAWCVALRACGARLDPADAVARYGVGSGLNAVAPAHVGSGVRVALFARVSGTGGVWRVAGASVAIGAIRATWLAALVTGAASTGIVPLWPAAALGGLIVAGVTVAIVARRFSVRSRIGHALDAFRALATRPGSVAAVAALTLGALVLKILAVTSVAAALGIERPVLAALVVVPAVELAAVLPLTPGNAGVASAAVAFALSSRGVGGDVALATGIAFGAIETVAAVAIGIAGALALAGPLARPAVRVAVAGAGGAAVACAFAVTVVLPVV